jgi:ABC-type ATPase involved in cell division
MIELVDVRLDHPRGGTPLVTGGNLKVAPGEVVLVVGAAGVGTSRLCAAALGEAALGAGEVRVLGHDVARLRRASLRHLRRRVGIVPQELCLLEDRSAELNVMLPLEIDGIPRTASIERATVALARLGLADQHDVPVERMSASARQRVAVARALVRSPDLILADHPTSLQDAEGAELIAAALAGEAARGAACLVLGRDPALRAIAERQRWRQLALVHGRLRPLGEIALDGATIEELLIAIDSAPTPIRPVEHAHPAIPNVLPFPITARTVGAR